MAKNWRGRFNPPMPPHEIEGDNFPEGTEEDDAVETGRGPEYLEPLPVGQIDPDKLQIITQADQMVGRVMDVPPQPSTLLQPQTTEIMTLRTGDGLNSMFSVSLADLGADRANVTNGIPRFLQVYSVPDVDFLTFGQYAIIQWGAGAVQYETAVDLVPGQVFTVGGSFLRILAVNYAKDEFLASANPSKIIRVGAFVSLLPKGSQRHAATLTRRLSDTPLAIGATSLGLTPPPFAKSIRIMKTPVTADYVLEFAASQGLVFVPVAREAFAANARSEDIPIPGLAHRARIINGAVQMDRAQAVYSLDL